jgi:hypothetical protein
MTLEDETGFVHVGVWGRVFEEHVVLLKTLSFLGVTGTVQKRDGIVHVMAESSWDAQALPSESPSGFRPVAAIYAKEAILFVRSLLQTSTTPSASGSTRAKPRMVPTMLNQRRPESQMITPSLAAGISSGTKEDTPARHRSMERLEVTQIMRCV